MAEEIDRIACFMNWQLLGPLLITTVVATGGWFVVHALAAMRDRANKKRELRISYLIEAYRRLETCANRRKGFDTAKMESAVADIQLFGTKRQVELVRAFAIEFAEKGTASLDELLQDLRRDLRVELSLESVPGKVIHLRISDDADVNQRESRPRA